LIIADKEYFDEKSNKPPIQASALERTKQPSRDQQKLCKDKNQGQLIW